MNTLKKLLQQGQQFAPVYPSPNSTGEFANHVPMALTALQQLGASDERITAYFEQVSQRLVVMQQSAVIITIDNFRQHLGKIDTYAAYLNFFQQQLDKIGRDKLINKYLPKFSKAIASHLFHPMIRIAYGLHSHDDQEIVAGFAYFAAVYKELGQQQTTQAEFSTALEAMTAIQDKFSNIQFDKDERNFKLRKLENDNKFISIINGVLINPNSLDEIAKLNASLYRQDPTIIPLHFVTSCHALRSLLPFLDQQDQLLLTQYYWYAIAVYFVILGCERFDLQASTDNKAKLSWNEIKQRAIASNNEHVIKFVHTCTKESAYYQQPNYQALAEMVLK